MQAGIGVTRASETPSYPLRGDPTPAVPLLRDNCKLLQQFRRGDPDALHRVYGAYARPLIRALARDFTTRSAESADLAHDVFMRAFSDNARTAYDERRPYLPYLLTIARNLAIDDRRRQRREGPAHARAVELGAGPAPLAAEEVLLLEMVKRYVTALPPRLRQVHEMRFIRDLSQARAAHELGTTRQRLRTLERELTNGLRHQLRE